MYRKGCATLVSPYMWVTLNVEPTFGTKPALNPCLTHPCPRPSWDLGRCFLKELHRKSREAVINEVYKCHLHDTMPLSGTSWQIQKVVRADKALTQHFHQVWCSGWRWQRSKHNCGCTFLAGRLGNLNLGNPYFYWPIRHVWGLRSTSIDYVGIREQNEVGSHVGHSRCRLLKDLFHVCLAHQNHQTSHLGSPGVPGTSRYYAPGATSEENPER